MGTGGKAGQISALQSLLRQVKQAGGFQVQQLIVGHGKADQTDAFGLDAGATPWGEIPHSNVAIARPSVGFEVQPAFALERGTKGFP